MTRWARAKNPHRHEKQPEEQATSWAEFMQQRKLANIPGLRPDDLPVDKKHGQNKSLQNVTERLANSQSKSTFTKVEKNSQGEGRKLVKGLKKKRKKKSLNSTLLEEGNVGNNVPLQLQVGNKKVRAEEEEREDVKAAAKQKRLSKSREPKLRNKRKARNMVSLTANATEADNSAKFETTCNTTLDVQPNQEAPSDAKIIRGRRKRRKVRQVQLTSSEEIVHSKSHVVAQDEVLDENVNLDEKINYPTLPKCEEEIEKHSKKDSAWLQKVKSARKEKNILLLPKKIERKLYLIKKSLRKRGLSGEEIKSIIRKERRKYELNYRKEINKLCFRCRQPGHVVSECPQIEADVEQGMDVCFKCGSTEHKIYQCPVKKLSNNEYPFAKCFICGEQGHLSRACPQNAHGVFPKGGACKLCGSKDHMKKDCLQLSEESKSEFVAQTVDLTASIDAEINEIKRTNSASVSKKIVKF